MKGWQNLQKFKMEGETHSAVQSLLSAHGVLSTNNPWLLGTDKNLYKISINYLCTSFTYQTIILDLVHCLLNASYIC